MADTSGGRSAASFRYPRRVRRSYLGQHSTEATLATVDSLVFALAVIAPGAVLMGGATVSMARSSIRHEVPSERAGRIFKLGLALLYLVPGVSMVAATLLGRLMWPAAFGGLFTILLGIGVLYGLRLNPPERSQ
jgi:hypothetical protein